MISHLNEDSANLFKQNSAFPPPDTHIPIALQISVKFMTFCLVCVFVFFLLRILNDSENVPFFTFLTVPKKRLSPPYKFKYRAQHAAGAKTNHIEALPGK